MGSLVIARLLTPATINRLAAGEGEQNLISPDPKEVYAASKTSGNILELDLGNNPAPYDTFFAGFLGGMVAPTWRIHTGAASPASSLVLNTSDMFAPSAVANPRRRHAFYRHSAPLTDRFVQFTWFSNSASEHTVGILGVGASVQPIWGREWGSGRQPIDMSAVAALRGGGFGIERGARMAQWRWTCGDLTDAELNALWNMAEEVGISAPVVVAEDPDYTTGLNERIHYGLFERPEAYAREIPGASRWSFQVREWV